MIDPNSEQPPLPHLPNVIVIDTCVLISSVLRPLLLRLGRAGWFKPVWSPVIGDEWRRTAARLWQTPKDDIADQWDGLQCDFPDADMGDINQYKIGLQYSDPKDWHVIAAARAALVHYPDAAVAIVTRNIKDFHRAELRRLGIGLFDPDQLISRMWLHNAGQLLTYLTEIPEYVYALPQNAQTLEAVLKRERLFRLNRLCQAAS